MLSAIFFNLDQSKILLTGNGLNQEFLKNFEYYDDPDMYTKIHTWVQSKYICVTLREKKA